MERLWVEVPDGMKRRLIDLSVAKGYEKPNELVLTALEKVLAGDDEPVLPPPSVPTVAPLTLESASQVFLAHVDADQRNLILSLCQENHQQPWDYLLSYIKLAQERGETSTLLSEQSRGEILPDPGAMAAIGQATISTCQFCGQTFQATRPGQIYCPTVAEGEESCSRKAGVAEIRAKRERRMADKKGDTVVAPRQIDVRLLQRSQTVG